MGWSAESVAVVDEDLARSGSSTDGRLGFKDLVAQVGLGQVGLDLGIEVRGWRETTPTGISCLICAR